MQYSKSVSCFRSSAIRDLMSLANRPDIISFAGGMPGNELFPVEDVKEIINNLSPQQWVDAMQYGPTAGYPPLIEAIKAWLKGKGFPVETNQVIITTGSLQALNITSKIFIDPEDTVLVENPSFIGAISAFRSYQAKIKGVAIDADGIVIDELKKELDTTNPKFLYIMPNFHNPAGLIYSSQRREELLTAMANTNIPIVEDDAYGELLFDDDYKKDIVPLKCRAQNEQQIIYCGSFSKIFGPGLRLGYMLVPNEIFRNAEICKQSMDACTPCISQVLAHQFMISGRMQRYIDHIRPIYKKRRDFMLETLQRYLPKEATFVRPHGGFYIWVKMPQGVDETELLKLVIDAGAVFVVGATFDPDEQPNGHIRISYCNTPDEQIEKGIKIIGDTMKRLMAR
ncbi:MAG TPA: PLP-dependent aminotransferase family protein [Paludibacteraceae bacterium]|jgi:2-aminoadipate transaminase|nr:PLP-dependent aminotransferase family protein [Paludibacteraceae bacterium]HPW96736.1 PLP-dependent aminotransferase family protein [Paludibacteraceae bacterium]HQC05250.1 PLP-dependent aminotransferase family protein [Paludibacteraceae bacterium]HRR59247.1 PLP-dependent aminotransferase family protein [Paludibacteraceae bacterium]